MVDQWPTAPADVARLDLLTAVEEVELARSIEAGLLAQERLDLGGIRDPLLVADLRRLVYLGERARDRMVLANLRLVHFWARRRWLAGGSGGLSLEDLVSEGTLGLIRGVQKFDFTLGFKFSTYSSWWIRQRMQRAVARSTAATVDHRTLEELARLAATVDDLTGSFGRTPSETELADDMGTTVRRIRELRSISRQAVSLDATLGEDSRMTIGDVVTAPAGDDGLAEAVAGDMRLQVQRLLRALSDRERRVLSLRFGLAGEPHTVEEAAVALGVTAEMVRDALNNALARLRAADGVGGLHVFLEAA